MKMFKVQIQTQREISGFALLVHIQYLMDSYLEGYQHFHKSKILQWLQFGQLLQKLIGIYFL